MGLRDRDVDGALEGVVVLCCVCGMRGEEGLTWRDGGFGGDSFWSCSGELFLGWEGGMKLRDGK